VTGAEDARPEPSSWPVTVTLWANVEEVSVAVYVPSPKFVTDPSDPAPTASVTVPPPVARLVPAAFFSCTVTVEVEAPFAVIEPGAAETVDWLSDATAVIEIDWAETLPSKLPALSFTFWAPVRAPGL